MKVCKRFWKISVPLCPAPLEERIFGRAELFRTENQRRKPKDAESNRNETLRHQNHKLVLSQNKIKDQ